MTEEKAAKVGHSKVVIRNIGLVLSGDLDRPILDVDTVVAVDGRISAIGKEKDLDLSGATTVVDANGTTLMPGLIDSHVHPVAGDWTPRQNQLGWIDSYRRAFDIISPVSGEVIEINDAVVQHPAHINAYPYARGGVLKVRVKTLRGYEELLRFEAYADLIRRLRRYDEWTKNRRVT